MLKVKDVFYSYDDGTTALNGINLEVKKGEIVALLGKNGAGKSTLFLQFNGILRPDSGEIFIEGKPLKYNKKSLVNARQKVGIVFQNPDDQIFAPTVEEDVAFGPLNLKLPIDEVRKRVTDALRRVGMEGFEKKAPHYLSGGQKKRIAIAGILAMKPEIMILDEPMAGLDPVGAAKIINLLKELNEEGITILISTHDVNIIQDYVDKIFVINDGEIIGDGCPEDIFSKKNLLKKAHLKLPIIARLFEKLEDNNIIQCNGEYPLTVDDAYLEIEKYLK